MNIVAFDLGASGGKIFSSSLGTGILSLNEIHRFKNHRYIQNGHMYWDVWDISRNLNIGLKKAQDLSPITSLGVDSFSNDFAFISPNGEVLNPVRCYRDARTAASQEMIYSRISPEELYMESGNQLSLFSTFMQLASMQQRGQSYFWNGMNRLLFLPDLLIYFLSGKAYCEYTLASVSQLFDYHKNDWNLRLLNFLNMPNSTFPELVQPGTILTQTSSEFTADTGIHAFPIVSVCEHDTASAFLASFAQNSPGKTAILSAGTWSILGVENPVPVICKAGYHANIANEGSFFGHHRLSINVMGSWLIQQLRNELALEGKNLSYSDISEIAESNRHPEFQFNVDDPSFFGGGRIRKKIRHLCMENNGPVPETTEEFISSVYYNLARAYLKAIQVISSVQGEQISSLNIVGGGAQDAALCKITSEVCKIPVVAGPVEATALGNVLAQLLAFGEISSIEEGRVLLENSFPLRVYESGTLVSNTCR